MEAVCVGEGSERKDEKVRLEPYAGVKMAAKFRVWRSGPCIFCMIEVMTKAAVR